MKKLFLIGALLCLVDAASAQTPGITPHAGAGGPRMDLENDAEIRAVFKEFETGWNRHDTGAMASLWTIDGDHVEPDGRVAKGRDEVHALFLKEHQTVFKDSHLELNIETVWFMTQDVALVDGRYVLSGVSDPHGKAISPRNGKLTAVMLEERGRWWVAASRLMIPIPLVWREE
jgi:uncharacterized protein (TIGR02246 family)